MNNYIPLITMEYIVYSHSKLRSIVSITDYLLLLIPSVSASMILTQLDFKMDVYKIPDYILWYE